MPSPPLNYHSKNVSTLFSTSQTKKEVDELQKSVQFPHYLVLLKLDEFVVFTSLYRLFPHYLVLLKLRVFLLSKCSSH